MPFDHLVDPIWRYKSALGYLGAALIAAGLLIMLTDRATGVVTVRVDYAELGWLMLTVTGLAPVLPSAASGLVKFTRLRLKRGPAETGGRSRDGGYPPPPAQIRTCGITAYGSCLGS